MTSDLLSVSVSGLRVAQSALRTTGHNISNAGVDGYSRQTINAVTNPSTFISGNYFGNGANVDSVDRQIDEFAITQVRQDTSLATGLNTYSDYMSSLDNLLSSSSIGLSGAMESFFASVQNGVDDPTSIPSRQLIVSEADNLSDRFNTVYGRLEDISNTIDGEIKTVVAQINAISADIASLNSQVSEALGIGSGAQPNDLLDQRDEALRSLSEFMSIQTYDQGNGQINVVVGNGQSLVLGDQPFNLVLEANEDDASKIEINYQSASGSQTITQNISGGKLGALISFRDDPLQKVENDLGRIALVLADTFNNVHSQGVDLNNQFGGDFFTDVNSESLAAARVIGSSNNSLPNDRELFLNIDEASDITTSSYSVEMSANGIFTVTRESDNTLVASDNISGALPQSVTFDGLELVFSSGSFVAGDQFTLQAVSTGARDISSVISNPEDIAFGSAIRTEADLGNSGSGSISSGEVLSFTNAEGEPTGVFSANGTMNPPLGVRFISDDRYEILDFSDPAYPVQLEPPIRNQPFTAGIANNLFGTDSGQTFISTNGDLIGLASGPSPVIGGAGTVNNYPAEVLTFTRDSAIDGGSVSIEQIITGLNASAKETASQLNAIDGVSASASNFIELSDTQNLSLNEPLQINFNGEALIEYEYDSVSMTNVISSGVPDPVSDNEGFNEYLANSINNNETFQAQDIYAYVSSDSVSGDPILHVVSHQGDDFDISLIADNTGPDFLSVNDGNNPSVNLIGNGVGISSALSIGGKIDLNLEGGLNLSTSPGDSLLFGDTQAVDFAQSSYLGIQASISGKPKAGDVFTIDFNLDGSYDNRNGLNLVGLQTQGTIDGETVSFAESYGALIEDVGIESASSKINADAAVQVLEQSEELRNSVSGVNLDEEAANLIRFEQMYSANTQVISVARDLFDRLLSSF